MNTLLILGIVCFLILYPRPKKKIVEAPEPKKYWDGVFPVNIRILSLGRDIDEKG